MIKDNFIPFWNSFQPLRLFYIGPNLGDPAVSPQDDTIFYSPVTGTFTHNPKNAQKSSKNFKPSIYNAVSTGTNFALYVSISCVRFARYCGKMSFSVRWILGLKQIF